MITIDKSTFITRIQNAGFITIAKFLDVPLNTAKQYNQNGELVEHLEYQYDRLLDHELLPYAEQFSEKSIWSEIKHDHYEDAAETGGFHVVYIDAYKTDDGDEVGDVIAKVIGALIDGKPAIYVSYQSGDARFDNAAQAHIAEVTAEIEQELAARQAEKDRKTGISSDCSH